MSQTAAIVGGGPAGLMAAEVLSAGGVQVTVFDAKPSMGRKFLMAGKSGLNLTKDEETESLLAQYDEAAPHLAPMIRAFDAQAVQDWARALDQPVFTGSSGRVFPDAMKASPLLRAWFARLDSQGVRREIRHQWRGWDAAEGLEFHTPQGPKTMRAEVVIFALGGASWARLGSDGAWAARFEAQGVPVTPFGAANVGLTVKWSTHMAKHFGAPLKGVAWHAADKTARGEAIISARGLEGGGIYALSRAVRQGARLQVDLLPDAPLENVAQKLSKPRGKNSLANHLRKQLKLPVEKIALLQEWARPLPQDPKELARLIKALRVNHTGLRPMDEAISTSGGVSWDGLSADLMLSAKPGVFCAGEMLDWEAPTGGYLLTACFATGRWAGAKALEFLQNQTS